MKNSNDVFPNHSPDYTFEHESTSHSGIPYILLIGFAIYVTYWTCISILKLFYFQATVFDLGISMQNLWAITHKVWTLSGLYLQFTYQGIAFILFPLQYGGYITLLVFQTVFLGMGSFAVYYISLLRGLDKKATTILSLSFLLYFPLSGMNWFDFHFQSLFVTIFLFGVYFYLKGNYRIASLVLFVSGLVRFPYAIFPLLFWIITGIMDTRTVKSRNFKLVVIFNVVLLSIFLIMSFVELQGGYIQTHTTGNTNPLDSLSAKLITIAAIFAPLLFLPVFSRRWFPLVLPFIMLMFVANSSLYEFPYLFTLQYSASFIAFVFLGLIEVLTINSTSKEKREHYDRVKINAPIEKFRHFFNKYKTGPVPKVILVILIVICITYQAAYPLSNLNSEHVNITSLGKLNHYETSDFYEIKGLIPKNNPYVLIQNNLPQFLPGPAGFDPRIPGYIGPNITQMNIQENNFSWNFYQFHGNTPIDYLIGDLNSVTWFHNAIVPSYPSFVNITSLLLSSGHYGIVGQCGPFIAVERGYHGLPQLYKPYNLTLTFNQNSVASGSLYDVFNNSVNGGLLLTSTGFNLPPGFFNVNIKFSGNLSTFSNLNTYIVGFHRGNYSIISKQVISMETGNYTSFNLTLSKLYYSTYIMMKLPINVSTNTFTVSINQAEAFSS